MQRKDIQAIPEYFTTYTNLIPEDMHLSDALNTFGIEFMKQELAQYEALGDRIYAPGKWNVKQTLVHIIDAERVFAYRALRFGRGDQEPLVGFEQDDYVANAVVDHRSIQNIFEEFQAVRQSSIELFQSFDDEVLQLKGIASGKAVSVLALGFMACGHLVHHQNIFNERYYPLLTQ